MSKCLLQGSTDRLSIPVFFIIRRPNLSICQRGGGPTGLPFTSVCFRGITMVHGPTFIFVHGVNVPYGRIVFVREGAIEMSDKNWNITELWTDSNRLNELVKDHFWEDHKTYTNKNVKEKIEKMNQKLLYYSTQFLLF